MKFCPRCGATDKDFYKGFCVDCYARMNEFVDAPKKMKIVKCKKCGFWFYKKGWLEDSYQNLVNIISEKVKTTLFDAEFELDIKDNVALLKLFGFADEMKKIQISAQKEIIIDFELKTCDTCLKISGKNYEVKIQIRRSEPFDAVKYKKVIDFIKKYSDFLLRSDERARSFWTEEKKEGMDFFFGFRQIGEAVVREIMSTFRVNHEMSPEFLGVDKAGKKKIRVTYCFRI
jgi:NMD protein affecting ribosome stability and mRNA decay